MQPVSSSFIAFCAFGSLAASVPIATFDGAEATTREWTTVNDPVMGGQNSSSITTDVSRNLGVWTGDVKIVPFLKAPGFCNLQSPGFDKTASFPDISASDGIIIRAREVAPSGLMHFKMQLMTKGAKNYVQKGIYSAHFDLTEEMADHFVPWSAFTCTSKGRKVFFCPDLTAQLKEINGIGLGTASFLVSKSDGRHWPFSVEIESFSAKTATKADSFPILDFGILV